MLMLPLIAALVACAPVTNAPRQETSWLPAPTAVTTSDSDRVLGFYHSALSLKGNELTREYDKTRQAFDKEKTPVNRMRLAMILSMPGSTFRDDAAALALLQPMLKDSEQSGSSLRPLALLMQNHVVETKRADEALQTQTGKLRDEQRRAEALQQKLEALLEMEMKMIEREQPAQPRKDEQQRQGTDRRQ